jgi:hypothetical protein
MAFRLFRQLYSLDTLDTRFVVPANVPPKEALRDAELDPAGPWPLQNGKESNENTAEVIQPSRWNTLEFYFYYLVFIVAVPLMFKSVLDVSSGAYKKSKTYRRTALLMMLQNPIQTSPSSPTCYKMVGFLGEKL